MEIELFQIDAFTSRIFGGNPAAVCPLQEWLPEVTLQQIAQENNLSETAFFVPKGEQFELRWFTPVIEVDLCGHATLATAFVLFEHLGYSKESIEFTTRSGLLTVTRQDDILQMDFPAQKLQLTEIPEMLIQGLQLHTFHQILKSDDYFVVLDTEQEVLSVEPRFDLLCQLDSRGVIVTAPGDDSDFVSRFFAPAAGILEDPVTGSIHCTLTPYWANRLKKKKLHAFQVSQRCGELFCELQQNRVLISGKASLFLRGKIFI